MPNSHDAMFHNPLEGNAYDPAPIWSQEELSNLAKDISDGKKFTSTELRKLSESKVMQNTDVKSEGLRQN